MLTPFETLERDEEKHAAHIVEILRRKQEKDYAPGSTRRDAHPKHTALLQAVFTVESGLPAELRVGVFAEPRSFEAWVRFSNANGTPQSDAVKDIRGCAIKLLDVSGERIPESNESTTQDFLFINIPTMPLGTMKLFHDIIYLSTEWSPLLFVAKMAITGHSHLLKELQERPGDSHVARRYPLLEHHALSVWSGPGRQVFAGADIGLHEPHAGDVDGRLSQRDIAAASGRARGYLRF